MIPDTNVIIAYLAGGDAVVHAFSLWRKSIPLFLPTVIETEVLSFDKWSENERRSTEQFLVENFTSVPFDRLTARIAAELRRDHRMKFPDAAIAASALHLHVPLATKNVRDFKKIPGLMLLDAIQNIA